MDIDHTRQDIYLGSSLGSILWQHQITESSSGRRRGWVPLVERVQSNITSLHLTSDDYIVSTHLGDMGRSGTLDCYKRLGGPNNLVSLDKVFTYSPQKSSIWSSSVAGDKIVVGADQKAIHFQGWKSGRPQVAHLWVGSDIFSSAIDPPEKGNLVYIGCRNGNVRIFDLNQPSLFSSAMEKSKKKQTVSLFSGIGHKESSVHCMRRVSEYYLITAAMNGEISMWDTRFIAKSGGGRGGGSSFKPGTFAKPLLSFRDSISNYSTKTRFDINEEETLLASDNIEGKLSLWSLRTGDRIQDFDVSGPTEATSTTEAPVVSCIAFSKDQRGIWAVTGDQLQYWGIPEHE
ncbi:hypothetical protein BGZ49_010622 [Haplosporangium sp. Z 27]|nr:hypothetical protein BGZ49_010622 [Haplosporangium sp. Z 27]